MLFDRRIRVTSLASSLIALALNPFALASVTPAQAVPVQNELRQKLGNAANLMESGRLDEAQADLQKIIKARPDSAAAYHLLGVVYAKQENYEQAEKALEKAYSLPGGKEPATVLLLCQVEFALKRVPRAVECARQASALAGNNPQAHYALGRLLRENSQPSGAVQELATAHALAPAAPAVTTELILADLDLGRAATAEDLFQSLLKTAAYGDLLEAGARFGEGSRFPFAVRAFARALELQPSSYNARFNLAFAYYREDEPQKALAALDRISPEHAQNQPDFHYLRGKIQAALHQREAAAPEYLAAFRLQPDNESLCSDAGLLFFQVENFWKALEIYQGCASRLPDSVPVETGLGLTYFRLGKYADAEDTLKKVLTLRPEADAAREALGFLYYVSGNLGKAKRLLESRLESPNADYYTWYLHALVLLRLEPRGDHQSALRSLDEALRRNPQFAPAYFQRARLRNESGQALQALADLDSATRLDTAYAEPYYLMAQIDYKLGRMQEAEQARRNYALRQREREEKQQKELVENRLVQALQ